MGDPSARVFEVFLIVLDGVQGETLWGGNPARATTLMSESESERQGNRQSVRIGERGGRFFASLGSELAAAAAQPVSLQY